MKHTPMTINGKWLLTATVLHHVYYFPHQPYCPHYVVCVGMGNKQILYAANSYAGFLQLRKNAVSSTRINHKERLRCFKYKARIKTLRH